MNNEDVELEIYLDWMSQPCRAIIALCMFNNIKFTVKEVRLMKGEHKRPEYLKISPQGKVPAIREIRRDDEFVLVESHAIMRYLCNTRKCAPNWYPEDPRDRALVDRYLDWHHSNLRQGASGTIQQLFLKVNESPDILKSCQGVLRQTLK